MKKIIFIPSILSLCFISLFFITSTISTDPCGTCPPPSSCTIVCDEINSSLNTSKQDFFNFTLDKPKKVTVTMQPALFTDYDLIMIKDKETCPSQTVYDCYPNFGSGSSEQCGPWNLSAGTYHVLVDYEESGTTYSLSMTCQDLPCSTCPPAEGCEIECGQTLTGLNTSTEQYFNFTLTSPARITVTMQPDSFADYNLIMIKNKETRPSTSSYDCYPNFGQGSSEQCGPWDLPAGTYYILVENVSGSGTYNIDLSCAETFCDYFIYSDDLPGYTISESNKYYCLIEDSNPGMDSTAITFASGVQSSTLDCLGYNIDGNDAISKNGIYLTGSGTKNNTIKNCRITDFCYAFELDSNSNNNTLINNAASSGVTGFVVDYSNNNTLIDNIAYSNSVGFHIVTVLGNTFINNTAYGNSNDGFVLDMSDKNTFINNTAYGNTKSGFYLSYSYNNSFFGGSFHNNVQNDYKLSYSWNDNFTQTNFTDSRKIYFLDLYSWFNYNNETTGNMWLKTNTSSGTTITRELTSWTQNLMQWNDSAATVTAKYIITGLKENSYYDIYDNSTLVEIKKTNEYGEINFTIYLSSEHEIKVSYREVTIQKPIIISPESKGYIAESVDLIVKCVGIFDTYDINYSLDDGENITFATISNNTPSNPYPITPTFDVPHNIYFTCYNGSIHKSSDTVSFTLIKPKYNFTAWVEGPNLYTIGRAELANIYIRNTGNMQDSYNITDVIKVAWKGLNPVSHLIDVKIPSNIISSVNNGIVGNTFATITLSGPIDNGNITFKIKSNTEPDKAKEIRVNIEAKYPITLTEFEFLGLVQMLIFTSLLLLVFFFKRI